MCGHTHIRIRTQIQYVYESLHLSVLKNGGKVGFELLNRVLVVRDFRQG